MSETGYNGWTNHATWMINLHLANDQDTYSWVNELAQAAWQNTQGEHSYYIELSDAIKDYVNGEDGLDMFGIGEIMEGNNLLLVDLVRSALDGVDWYEIAKSWIDDPLYEFGPAVDAEDD